MSSSVTKVTVNLPDSTVDDIDQIAKRLGITKTEAIRRSIEMNKFLLDQEAGQGRLLIEHPDGKFDRIIRK